MKLLAKKMDARIKSGHDDFSAPVNPSLILLAKMAAAAAAVSRGLAADVVISRVF
jgi:hypothetical protein